MIAKAIGETNGKPAAHSGEVVEVGSSGWYVLNGLRREDREEAIALERLTPDERVSTIERWLSLGAALDKRASGLSDADHLARENERIMQEAREWFAREIRLRFDPNGVESLTRPIVDHARESKRALGEAQQKLDEMLRANFDPNDARSVVARIATLLHELEAQMEVRFDPRRKDSVVGRFDERCDQLVKGLCAADGPFQRLSTELQDLRTDMARVDAGNMARATALERSPEKGIVFEQEVEERTIAVARIFGDVVERVSTKPGPSGRKSGDLTIDIAEKSGRIVVEAKSGTISSLPKLLRDLEASLANREADFAIAVVRQSDDLPRQARPFQFYGAGIVVAVEHLEFVLRVARWIVAAQSESG